MKYFLPEWGDLVDPKYDFITDTYSEQHTEDMEKNDTYIWDVFGLDKVPIDGILVSRTKLEENKRKLNRVREQGLHEFLHLPQYFEIIGDCGAFGYIEEDRPTFETQDTLDYYLDLGFNIGVSVDHLIVRKMEEQNQDRWNITVNNAREMYEFWDSKDRYKENLRIMGVAQGWDTESYVKAVKELLEIGYDYIGIGGLTRAPSGKLDKYSTSKTVSNVVRSVCHTVRKWTENTKSKIDIHIFGFSRLHLIKEFHLMGVTTFDSASYMRSAWLSGKNYFTEEQAYKALRIPHYERTRSRRIIDEKLSSEAMNTLRAYDNDSTLYDSALEIAKEVGVQAEIKPAHIEGYEEVLQDRPWEKCDCPICKTYGIETVIFRGNERNRRRGFHNTHIFYKMFRKQSPKILAITSCTGTKNKAQELLPAYQRYHASPLFKTFWNQVHDLPIDIKILSAKYGIIEWNQHIPDYDQKMNESQVNQYTNEVITELSSYEKIYFIGLGLYRKIFENAQKESSINIEIYPKTELTTRNTLDVIEYTKQMKFYREKIIEQTDQPYSSSKLALNTLKSYMD